MATKAAPQEEELIRERITKEGRRLNYCLKVIQQPERARACGSGAKSSADRRPVDPPPVVRLSIYEGDIQQKNDVTFSYDANFFLFATLELYRPIAHGRVQPSAQQIPVLTGMPVSGMAYLDRPHEAGYFIFPDLSVRHEGKYRLSFNLYEETKNAKDRDAEESPDSKKLNLPQDCPHGSFDWRMEIKSNPFLVYSAKKFPGLSESTSLSRTVAEQGCRVRIRRDVRMRRRDGKAGGDYDDFDDEYSRSRRTATPDSVHDAYSRPRSLSNADADRQPYIPDVQRRASGVDYPQQPYSSNYGPAPVTPQSSGNGYLSFGGSSAQQYQAPQFTQPQLPPQSSQTHQYQAPAPPTVDQPPPYRQPSTGYAYPERPPYASQYPPQRDNYEQDYRRASVGYPGNSAAQPPNQYQHAEQNYNRPGQPNSYPPHYPARAHSPVQQAPVLAPLKMLDPKYQSLASPIGGPLSAPNRMAPSLPSPSYPDRPSAFTSYPSSVESSRNNKRPYESVFSSSTYNQPLHNGMRPTSAHHTQASSTTFDDDDDDDAISMEALRMQYKRADGTNHCRDLPTLE